MTRRLLDLIRVLPLMLLLCACGKDEAPLPPYVQELADLQTDATGRVEALVTDAGEPLTLANMVSGLRPDTTYRVVAAYVRNGTAAQLTSYAPILAPRVARYADHDIHTDPLTVTACWRGANYINLRLALRASVQGVHYLGFHETDYLRHADGSRTMCVRLLHNQNGDPLYYTRETYISLPLEPLHSLLQAGRDSLRLTVTTFTGEYVKTFAL